MNTVKTHAHTDIRTGKDNFPFDYVQDFPQHWNGMGEGHQTAWSSQGAPDRFGRPCLTGALEIPYIYTASLFSTVQKCAFIS